MLRVCNGFVPVSSHSTFTNDWLQSMPALLHPRSPPALQQTGFCATPSLARLSPTRFRSGFIRGMPIQPAVQILGYGLRFGHKLKHCFGIGRRCRFAYAQIVADKTEISVNLRSSASELEPSGRNDDRGQILQVIRVLNHLSNSFFGAERVVADFPHFSQERG